MARTAVQRAGRDGSYRMTIDKKYSSLPTLRRIAKLLWPLWLLLVLVKTAFVAAPLHSSADSADTMWIGMLVGTAVIGTGLWLLAGLGSKRERVQSVMLLNVLLAVSIAALVLRTAREHFAGGEARSTFEADELHAVLESYIPSLQSHELGAAVRHFGTVVDAASVLVGVCLAGLLHLYISGKKAGGAAGRKMR